MDVVKALLAARPDKSPEVQQLLNCLSDPCFALQVCVCSVGGVGSTQLTNLLTRAGIRCNLLTDQDAIRHVNRPPSQQLGQDTQLVYLFGDPLACVASHYRRGHAHHQALKTSGNAQLDEASFPPDLQAYVDRGEDLFGLRQHLDNWLSAPADRDVLFVRYERMFDAPVAAAMLRHICLPRGLKTEAEVAAMAQQLAASRRPRASRVTPEQAAAMYGELAARVDALPPLFVRRRDGSRVPLLAAAEGGGGA